jgi:PAS domain S-box-containing protein
LVGNAAALVWVSGTPPLAAAIMSLVCALQFGSIALVLRRYLGPYFDLTSLAHVTWLGGMVAATTLIKVGLTMIVSANTGWSPPYVTHSQLWPIGIFLGYFVLSLPILAISHTHEDERFKLDWLAFPLLALLIVAVFLIYGPVALAGLYLILPLLMVMGWRYGVFGAGLAMLVNNALGLVLDTATDGIARRLMMNGYDSLVVGLRLELFFTVGIIVSLPIAVARSRQVAMERALQRAVSDLEGHLSTSQQLEARWHTALESAGLGVWETNLRTLTTYYSRRWREVRGLAGLGEEEIKNDRSWIHPADAEMFVTRLNSCKAGQTDFFEAEYRARCLDGSYKWVAERGTILERASDGAPVRIIGTSLDIDRAKSAILLADRRSRLFAAVAAANLAIAQRQSMHLLAETVCRILVEEGDIALAWIGMPNAEGSHVVPHVSACKEGQDRYLEGLEVVTTYSEGVVQGLTGPAVCFDRPVWVEDFLAESRGPWGAKGAEFGWRGCAALPIRQREGASAMLFLYTLEERFFDAETRSILTNMTAQLGVALDALDAEAAATRYQDDLQDSEHRFRTMFEAAPLGIALKNERADAYVDANPKFLEIVGWEREELAAKHWQEITHPDDVARETEAAGRFVAGEVPEFRLEKRVVTADGEVRWVKMTSAGFAAFDDGQGSHLIMLEDITEHKALAEQLHQAQRMEAMGQLTGGIAHDFNNLLTVVMGNSEALVEESADANQQELANLILHAAERAQELTGQLLAFARRQPLSPRSFDLEELLGKVEALSRRTIGGNLELSVEVAADLQNAFADPGMTESAILNLCLNARDAMPNGGHLTVRSANSRIGSEAASKHPDVCPGDYVEIRVSDSGIGMPPEVVARIFEPFFTTKEPGRGTGLGLSMVYGFVKQSGGFLDVASEVGRGTTIAIYLPAAAKTVEAVAQSGSEPLPRGSERLLLVEDDELVRTHVRRQLESLGYDVLEAADGPAALAIIEERADLDLLFTDVMMPSGTNGRELAEAAAKLRPNLPVLFTSGYPSDALLRNGRLPDGLTLLAKPYTKRALAEKLRQMLRRGGSDRAVEANAAVSG